MLRQFNRLILTGVLVLSVTALLATSASGALTLGSLGSYYQFASCHLYAESLAKGLGFCEDLPEGVECARVGVELETNEILFKCENPGGNCGGVGEPFARDISIDASTAVGPGDISGTGKALVDVCWECNFLTDELITSDPNLSDDLDEDCMHNPNYLGWCETEPIYINDMNVTFYGCTQDEQKNSQTYGQWFLIHQIDANCVLSDPSLLGKEGELPFYCTEIAGTKYKISQNVLCPVPPPLQLPAGTCIGD